MHPSIFFRFIRGSLSREAIIKEGKQVEKEQICQIT